MGASLIHGRVILLAWAWLFIGLSPKLGAEVVPAKRGPFPKSSDRTIPFDSWGLKVCTFSVSDGRVSVTGPSEAEALIVTALEEYIVSQFQSQELASVFPPENRIAYLVDLHETLAPYWIEPLRFRESTSQSGLSDILFTVPSWRLSRLILFGIELNSSSGPIFYCRWIQIVGNELLSPPKPSRTMVENGLGGIYIGGGLDRESPTSASTTSADPTLSNRDKILPQPLKIDPTGTKASDATSSGCHLSSRTSDLGNQRLSFILALAFFISLLGRLRIRRNRST